MFFKPLLLLPFLFSSLRLLAHTSVKFKLCANARRMRRLENLEVDATLTSLAASALICMSVKFIREANNEIILKSCFYHKKVFVKHCLQRAHMDEETRFFTFLADRRKPSAVPRMQFM